MKPFSMSQSAAKMGLSIVSLSILLLLGGCSDDQAVATTEVEAEPIAAIEPVTSVEAPTIEATELSDIAEPSENVAAEAIAVHAEPEVLAADAGAQLYEAQCKACHANGLLNAPKYGDKVAWGAALAKDKQMLYNHSAQGFNKMPAQAVNGISEAQVVAAVDYMLAAVN